MKSTMFWQAVLEAENELEKPARRRRRSLLRRLASRCLTGCVAAAALVLWTAERANAAALNALMG